MKFKRYNSIENHYRQKFLELIEYEGFSHKDVKYCVTEKIHGANFSLWTDGVEVKAAKRSGFIQEDEKFFNHNIILDKYKDRVLELFQYYKNKIQPDLTALAVFGEIHGANVQKEVFYSEKVEFRMFDLLTQVGEDSRFANFNRARNLCVTHNIPACDILKVGTLKECLEYPNSFTTLIPSALGQKEQEGRDVVEGVVIKPLFEQFNLMTGNRIIIKSKNDRFTEKSKVKKPKVLKPLPAELASSIHLIDALINENRLRSVLSKIGQFKKSDFSKVMKSFTADVVADLRKDLETFDDLSKSNKKLLFKHMGSKSAQIIRPIILTEGE